MKQKMAVVLLLFIATYFGFSQCNNDGDIKVGGDLFDFENGQLSYTGRYKVVNLTKIDLGHLSLEVRYDSSIQPRMLAGCPECDDVEVVPPVGVQNYVDGKVALYRLYKDVGYYLEFDTSSLTLLELSNLLQPEYIGGSLVTSDITVNNRQYPNMIADCGYDYNQDDWSGDTSQNECAVASYTLNPLVIQDNEDVGSAYDTYHLIVLEQSYFSIQAAIGGSPSLYNACPDCPEAEIIPKLKESKFANDGDELACWILPSGEYFFKMDNPITGLNDKSLKIHNQCNIGPPYSNLKEILDLVPETIYSCGSTASINNVLTQEELNRYPIEYYNILGQRVYNPTSGVYIKVQGPTKQKVFLNE